ncbi:MAG: hypothetical protein J6T10_22105 [Methanobrevibacter sp.]|nr:hypothetical protein [Methanobrevibacter sp.]
MVKFGYIKCENCGKEVKKTKQNQHKCFKHEEQEVCPICGLKVSAKHYNEHYNRCRGKEFWVKFKPCFLFILRGVRRFNLNMKKAAFQGSRFERQSYLDLNSIPGSLLQNRELFSKLGQERENKALEEDRRRAKKMGIDFDKLYLSEAIKDTASDNFPGISVRQVIFTFLKNNKIGDDKLYNLIDMKLYKYDYPTDEEIQSNLLIWTKIEKLRAIYRYNEMFQVFYHLLYECYHMPYNHKCQYCLRYFVNIKNHYKVCFDFKKAFYKHRDAVISDYLKMFDCYDKWSSAKVAYYLNYYKESSHEYFLDTIKAHVKNRRKFLDTVERKENEERRQRGEVRLGKRFVCDLINEVRVWCDMKPHKYKIKNNKRIIIKEEDDYEESEEVSESESNSLDHMNAEIDEDEEVDYTEEEIPEKDIALPYRIPEKEVQAMRLLLKPKVKKIEPKKKEEPKEEPKEKEKPIDEYMQLSNALTDSEKNKEFYKLMGFNDFNFLG